MLWVVSEMCPIIGVHTAPPIMAIIIIDPPIFVFGPRPFTPKAKMVGNISDIKKLDITKSQTPKIPGIKMATVTITILKILNSPISLSASTLRRSAVETNRPIPNACNA